MLTLKDLFISESCIEVKIELNFCFHTALWCLKRFYEGLSGPYYLSLFDVEFPFMKAFKAFIKPFEAPQRTVKIKI